MFTTTASNHDDRCFVHIPLWPPAMNKAFVEAICTNWAEEPLSTTNFDGTMRTHKPVAALLLALLMVGLPLTAAQPPSEATPPPSPNPKHGQRTVR